MSLATPKAVLAGCPSSAAAAGSSWRCSMKAGSSMPRARAAGGGSVKGRPVKVSAMSGTNEPLSLDPTVSFFMGRGS